MFVVAGIFLAPTVLIGLGFVLARRWIEPTCPTCQGKTWLTAGSALTCTHCGWSTLPAQPAPASDAIAA